MEENSGDLRVEIKAALYAEWHERVQNPIFATPEEHCDALADAVMKAIARHEKG